MKNILLLAASVSVIFGSIDHFQNGTYFSNTILPSRRDETKKTAIEGNKKPIQVNCYRGDDVFTHVGARCVTGQATACVPNPCDSDH